MVPQALAHPRKLVDLGYARRGKLVRRTDARQQEYVGGADGPAAQDDLVGLDHEGLSPGLHLNAGRPLAVKQYPVHRAVGGGW